MPGRAAIDRAKSASRRRLPRRRGWRLAITAANAALLAGVLLFVLHSSSSSTLTASDSASSQPGDTVVTPIDKLASTNIAVTVARLTSLPESTAITNQADSQNAAVAQLASSTGGVTIKPQVVQTSLKSRADIITYITGANDTVDSIAAKFGLSPNSIIWSNGLNSGTIAPNQKLFIPPVNGIIYTVQAGDTPASLAAKFSASEQSIVNFNDAELGGLKPGEQIVIPGGQQYVAPSLPWGSRPIYGYNGYDYGNCTWYVANNIAVPSNWGNASSWAYYARLSGWSVGSAPSVGAIAQTPYAAGGYGHVAIVEAVNGDMIQFSDMNNYGDGGGYGRVGHSGWVPASTFPNYITH